MKHNNEDYDNGGDGATVALVLVQLALGRRFDDGRARHTFTTSAGCQ